MSATLPVFNDVPGAVNANVDAVAAAAADGNGRRKLRPIVAKQTQAHDHVLAPAEADLYVRARIPKGKAKRNRRGELDRAQWGEREPAHAHRQTHHARVRARHPATHQAELARCRRAGGAECSRKGACVPLEPAERA